MTLRCQAAVYSFLFQEKKKLNIFLIASLWWRTLWWILTRTRCRLPLETPQKQSCQDILGELTEPRTRFAFLGRSLCLVHTPSPYLPRAMMWPRKDFPDLSGNKSGKEVWSYVASVSWENIGHASLHACKESKERHAVAAPQSVDLNNRSRRSLLVGERITKNGGKKQHLLS